MNIGKTVSLVTGSASGLGKATVSRLTKQGGRVIVADLESSNGIEVCEKLNELAGKEVAFFSPCDVTSEQDVLMAIDLADEKFNEGINTVINCAGIAPAIKTLSRKGVHPLDIFEKVMKINISGTFNVCRLGADRMAKNEVLNDVDQQRGVIINTASISGYDGQIGQAAYATSKGAVISMGLVLARDLSSYGIRVNTIAPGLFLTPLLEGLPDKVQTVLGENVPFPSRLGRPDEFAQLCQSIIENPMLNGECIRIDGALRMQP